MDFIPSLALLAVWWQCACPDNAGVVAPRVVVSVGNLLEHCDGLVQLVDDALVETHLLLQVMFHRVFEIFTALRLEVVDFS